MKGKLKLINKLENLISFSVLCTLLSAQVFAYERSDSDADAQRQADVYVAQGMHVGGFTLYPYMGISNEFNTNIYKTDKSIGEFDSYIFHLKPGLELKSNWNRHNLEFSVNTDLAEFSTQSEQNNYQDVFASLSGRLDVLTESYLLANYNFSHAHEDRGSPDQRGGAEPTIYDLNTLEVAYQHKFNRFSINPGFLTNRYDYESTETSTGVDIPMQSRNRWEYVPSVKLRYEIQPEYDVFAEFVWREVDYDTIVNSVGGGGGYERDSYGYNALLGFEFDLTGLITGDMAVGYLQRDYKDSRFDQISGVNGYINLEWRPTLLTTVLLRFDRDIMETTQAGVSGNVSTGVEVMASHELLRNLSITMGGNYRHNEYNGYNRLNTVLANRKERMEDIYGGTVGIMYLVNRYLNVSVDYTYSSRDVNYTNSDYEVQQVMINLRGQL